MAAKRRVPPHPIDQHLADLVVRTMSSYRAMTGEEMPLAFAREMVRKVWIETWPLYLSAELATVCGLGQIAEMNGATISGESAAATDDAEDDAEE